MESQGTNNTPTKNKLSSSISLETKLMNHSKLLANNSGSLRLTFEKHTLTLQVGKQESQLGKLTS